MTLVTVPAATLNVALPAQLVAPSVPVAVNEIEKPPPTGRPPMTAEMVLLEATLMVPDFANPFGPLIA